MKSDRANKSSIEDSVNTESKAQVKFYVIIQKMTVLILSLYTYISSSCFPISNQEFGLAFNFCCTIAVILIGVGTSFSWQLIAVEESFLVSRCCLTSLTLLL